MTTRPIELGLARNPDGQSPSPWQIHIVATIVAGLGAWTADPDSPRTADFQTRIDRLRKTLVAGMSSHELSDTVERVLHICDIYFEDTRIICRACRKAYPIRDGIPVMLISEAQPWAPGA